MLHAVRAILSATPLPAAGALVLKNGVWTPIGRIAGNSCITAIEYGVTVAWDAGTLDVAIGPGTSMLITAAALGTPGVFPIDPAAGAPGPSYPAAIGYQSAPADIYVRMNGAPTVGGGNVIITYAPEAN